MERRLLLEALDRGLSGALTLISAPAGFGKSTLLAAWAAARSRPVAWLSLDPGDADAGRFLDYLIAALRAALPNLDTAAAEQLLHSAAPPPVDAVLTSLVNDLAEEAGGPVAVVLDDYHHADEPGVHRVVAFLVEHLPPGVHLVLATRADPPLPLARWRGRGQLTEIRAPELRMSPSEASEFLRATMGLDLGPEEVALLCTRTEGWAAGLQLAALFLRGRGDAATYLEGLAGAEGLILDYLGEEVLSHLPADTEAFLLHTSILDRLCGPLCDALTGRRDAARMLRSLERQNLFLESLDEERRWYRYHRLFSGLIRDRLHREHPELVPGLHRRASAWHEAQGITEAAVGHAAAAGDAGRAARLVEEAAEATLAAGEFRGLLRWLEPLPREVVRSRPELCAFEAMARFYAGHSLGRVEESLVAAETGSSAAARGLAAALRAVMAAIGGDGAAARELASRALELLPDDRRFGRQMAGTTAGLAALYDGDLDTAERSFEETLQAASATGNLVLQVLAGRRLAGIAALRGDLSGAEARYRHILGITSVSRGKPDPLAAPALVGLGNVAAERDNPADAETKVLQGLELALVLGAPFAIDGRLALSRILQRRGDLAGAAAELEEARRLAVQFDATADDDHYVAAAVARLHLDQGDLAGAARWAQGLEASGRASPGARSRFYPGEMEQVTLARFLLQQGRPEQALAVVGPLVHRAEAQGRWGSVIELEILQALAHNAAGAARPAGAALARALSLAAPHGHRRVFLDEGQALAAILRRAVASGTAPAYGKVVLASFSAGAALPVAVPGLSEPLTARERRVLRLLPGSLTLPEIAEELYVAPSTVRSHVKAIYRKLGVGRRAAAVERARELGLL